MFLNGQFVSPSVITFLSSLCRPHLAEHALECVEGVDSAVELTAVWQHLVYAYGCGLLSRGTLRVLKHKVTSLRAVLSASPH